MKLKKIVPALGVLVVLAVPGAASAASISYEGGTLVYRAAAGEENWVNLSSEQPGRLSIGDSGAADLQYPADRCDRVGPEYPAHCDIPGSVRVEMGDGADRGTVFSGVPAVPITILGGAGGDKLKAFYDTPGSVLDGGDDRDEIESESSGDVLIGGAGDDDLFGGGGNDELRGGDGQDLLRPDFGYGDPGNDVVDGGAGVDSVDDWADSDRSRQTPVAITLDGQANDGRSGESDNVIGVEKVKAFVAGTFVMGDTDDTVEIYSPSDLGASKAAGRGGNDVLIAGTSDQTLDGGAGDDRLEGGFGDDTLVGGPGRDVIDGDMTASQCGVLQSCTIPHGDDLIDARDGDADKVDCGVGNDRAMVDAQDPVSNCETVEQGAGGGGGGAAASAAIELTGTKKLRKALKRGLKIRLSGVTGEKATVKALLKGRPVGKGSGKVTAGTAMVTVRFTAKAKRRLRRAKRAKLTLVAGALTRTVTLAR